MKIGIVGYQSSGKSTLFQWITETPPDPALAHTTQSAMAPVPDPRIEGLRAVYRPKKVSRAALEVVDSPGLSRTHEGNAQKLAMIREAGCLVIVVAAFGGNDPLADLSHFEDDLLITDLEIVSNRLQRLRESVRKPRPNRDELQAELEALEPLQAALDEGRALREIKLTGEQKRAVKSFQLLSEKPRLVIFNMADDQQTPEPLLNQTWQGHPPLALSLALQLELARMDADEREEFCREMGVQPADAGDLLRQIMFASGQMLFFTAGEKEVRSWLIRQGGTAVEAAGCIHTDLARGFIRAEVMNCDDLIRLGSEREVKAQNLHRQEHKEYVLQDGDVLNIRHN